MKKLLLSIGTVIALATIGMGTFGAWTYTTTASALRKSTVGERIKKTDSSLTQLAKALHADSTVLVSFNDVKKKDVISRLSGTYRLKIRQFHHIYKAGNSVFRGGYVPKDGETVDDALKNYESRIKDGIESSIADLKLKLEKEKGRTSSDTAGEKAEEARKVTEAMRSLLADEENQLTDMKVNGLGIYGMEVSGANRALLMLRKDANVRVMEVLDDTDKKATPLSPLVP